MSKERPQPSEPYGFTEREKLYDRISHQRFMSMIADEQTAVHQVKVDTNSFGEFLFVSTSRAGEGKPVFVTFYGVGYHEYRERWIRDEWFWYEMSSPSKEDEQKISNEETLELIRQRQEAIAAYKADEPQSARGKLYELLADLTDEDGAWAEMDDLGDLADLLGGDE